MLTTCEQCHKEFVGYSHRISRFCGMKCYGKNLRGKPTWNKGTKGVMKPNPTSFKKDLVPWNKGTKGIMKAWNKGLKSKTGDEKHHKWKGDAVGYFALHAWINRKKGRARRCEHCGLSDPERMYHWANKSHQYLRDLSDWISLCVPCHRKYDALPHLAVAA